MLNQGYDDDRLKEQLARDLVEAAIRHGLSSGGNPAESVVRFYGDVFQQLTRIDRDAGHGPMTSAARFAITAIDGGIIYPGAETIDFLREVARGVDAANRESGGASAPPRF